MSRLAFTALAKRAQIKLEGKKNLIAPTPINTTAETVVWAYGEINSMETKLAEAYARIAELEREGH